MAPCNQILRQASGGHRCLRHIALEYGLDHRRGGTLHVSCEILAYQAFAAWAWSVLPASAIREPTGLTAFAASILGTFLFEPSHTQKQPLVVGMPDGIT